MQDNLMQAAMQPYLGLVQANLELIAKFSTSPEVAAQAASAMQGLQQGPQSTAGVLQSNAFAQLAQGIVKNYTEFLTAMGQAGTVMLSQSQAALTRQVQEASERVVEASHAAGRGVRKLSSVATGC